MQKNLVSLVFLLFFQTSFGQNLCERVGISNGWMLDMTTPEVDQITKACADSGALYFRTDFAWSDVQYVSANHWNWTNVDRIVNSAIVQDLEMIAILDYFPPWADVNTDTTFWYNFAYEAGLRYIPQGVVIWEMWNEPNIINFWPNPDVEDYVEKILKPGSNAIRQAARELGIAVMVLTGGLAPAATDGTNISQIDFITEIYANGAKDYFDAVGHHPYCWPLDPSLANPYNWFLKTEDIYNVMVANGDATKNIWGTEMGWPTHNINNNGVSEATQAVYLAEAFHLWNNWSWTGPLVWYAYNDAGDDFDDAEDNFGLVDFDFNPKLALDSFLQITSTCEIPIITATDIIIENSSINLFPNPVANEFSIDGLIHAYKIQIFDSNGNLYEDFTNSTTLIKINLQDLPAGVYFILLQRKNYSELRLEKLLKMN